MVAVAVSEDERAFVCVARSIGATGRMRCTESDAYGARGGLIAARRCQDAKRVLADFEAAGDIRKVQVEQFIATSLIRCRQYHCGVC